MELSSFIRLKIMKLLNDKAFLPSDLRYYATHPPESRLTTRSFFFNRRVNLSKVPPKFAFC